MLDRIFKIFFSEKKQNKKTACLTLVRDSSLFNEYDVLSKNRQIGERIKRRELTCLSEYFIDIKGLNLEEREKANLVCNV